jgi:hypothetical protein
VEAAGTSVLLTILLCMVCGVGILIFAVGLFSIRRLSGAAWLSFFAEMLRFGRKDNDEAEIANAFRPQRPDLRPSLRASDFDAELVKHGSAPVHTPFDPNFPDAQAAPPGGTPITPQRTGGSSGYPVPGSTVRGNQPIMPAQPPQPPRPDGFESKPDQLYRPRRDSRTEEYATFDDEDDL